MIALVLLSAAFAVVTIAFALFLLAEGERVFAAVGAVVSALSVVLYLAMLYIWLM